MRIAVNLARDHVKSRRWQFWHQLFSGPAGSEKTLEPVDPHASQERSLLARERFAHVLAAVDNLPNQQRAVFVLRFLEEMSIEEIAQATSLRPGTVKAHLFRAVSAVRGRVKEQPNP
jgi:RNA polymerase sigma-70 factor (ECF subfamily)